MAGSHTSTNIVLGPAQVFSGKVELLTSLSVLGSGWEIAIPEMTVGEQSMLIIPRYATRVQIQHPNL
jgi:hypothetical protein